MANVGALDQVRSFLREHPDAHDQGVVTCGTVGCIAGWAVALDANARYGQDIDAVVYPFGSSAAIPRAQVLLGLTDREADALFVADIDEDDALALVDAIIAREKGELTDEQRALLESYSVPTEAGS